MDEDGWHEPAGFHLIPLPFADDIRAAPVEECARGTPFPCSSARAPFSPHPRPPTLPLPYIYLSAFVLTPPPSWLDARAIASDELKDEARKFVDKLTLKNGTYTPDAHPNPGETPAAPSQLAR